MDLFLAKCATWREKDRKFNQNLFDAGLLNPKEVLERLPEMPVGDKRRKQLEARVLRMAKSAGLQV